MAKKEQSFEQALARLETIVGDIEEGKIGLEESITRYEEGMRLLRRCQEILARSEARIQKLQAQSDGTLQPEPLDEQPADD